MGGCGFGELRGGGKSGRGRHGGLLWQQSSKHVTTLRKRRKNTKWGLMHNHNNWIDLRILKHHLTSLEEDFAAVSP